MTDLTRNEVLANRQQWIDFLCKPKRKKAADFLDRGNGFPCCLGHGCYALGIRRELRKVSGIFLYDGAASAPPQSFVGMVGLHPYTGAASTQGRRLAGLGIKVKSLIELNDETDFTPQEIGKYLESVIVGGEGTPFIALTHYPE